MKKALIIIGAVFILFIAIIAFAAFFLINQEDASYVSNFEYIDATYLKTTSRKTQITPLLSLMHTTAPAFMSSPRA